MATKTLKKATNAANRREIVPAGRKTHGKHAAKAAVSKRSAAGPARQQPYHHGDLHEALLQAAKRVADREGINGLTLRAVAREAGVSHAAPAHHFGDIT